MNIPFENTKQGKLLFEVTLPKIARALERIADALESQNKMTTEQLKESKKSALRKKTQTNIDEGNERS